MTKLACGCIVALGLIGTLIVAPVSSADPDQRAQSLREADCADFATQAAAQNYFIAHGGPSSDPDGLDADHDGVACEANPCPCSTGGGGGGGGGPAPPPPPPPDPVKTDKRCGKFVGISGSHVCFKATTQGGKLRKVSDFRFRGLPATCEGEAQKQKVAGKRAKIDGDGQRFRSRRLSVLGNFSAVDAKAAGKVTNDGKKAKGEVRVRYRNANGAPCDTDGRKWKVG